MISADDAKDITLRFGNHTVFTSYFELGPSDAEHVVLMHTGGVGVSAYMCWQANLDALATVGYHVLAPDAPGFGQTAAMQGGTDRDFLEAFMDATGVSAAHLIGNSMGGITALRFALDLPERVRTITVSGGEPRADTVESRPIVPALGETPRNNFVREMFAKPELAFEDMLRATADFFYDRSHPAVDTAARLRFQSLSDPERFALAKERAVNQPTRRRATADPLPLSTLQAPTFLLHGRDEPWFYPSEIEPALIRAAVEAAFEIPDCRLMLLPHCGHWPQLERTETYNSVVLEFLGSHGGK